eukprot:gb/GECH01007414.1/.p1 GENE.gb/GECH01007414.1/~~gb/GECH01007414.1/.p1  ORF type:complete len:478 (+),score=87.77 gb/GECH01007414.1/:1-1434(+)
MSLRFIGFIVSVSILILLCVNYILLPTTEIEGQKNTESKDIFAAESQHIKNEIQTLPSFSSFSSSSSSLYQPLNPKQRKKTIRYFYGKYFGKGNLGDEILEASFLTLLNDACSRAQVECIRVSESNKTIELDLFVLGGGSLLRSKNLKIYQKMQRQNNHKLPIFIFGSGWDDYSKEGDAIPLAHDIASANDEWGEYDRILTSNSAHSLPQFSAFKMLDPLMTYGGIRGPVTHALMKQSNPSLDLPIIGDSGLLSNKLFPPEIDFDSLKMKLGLSPDKCQSLVVVNHGGIGLKKKTASYVDEQDAIQYYVDRVILPSLNSSNKCVIGLPVVKGDIKVMKKIEKETRASPQWNEVEYSHRYVTITSPKQFLNYSFVMSVYGMAEYSVNYKLHGMILSAAARTPFLCFGYHLKIYDFAAQAQLSRFIINGDDLSSISNKLSMLIEQKQEIRNHLERITDGAWIDYQNIFDDTIESLTILS